MSVRTAAWICLSVVLATTGGAQTIAPAAAIVLDDRGEPVQGTVSVCRSKGLDQVCADRTLNGEAITLGEFDLLQLEGPEHGPTRFEAVPDDGILRLPRKARLRVNGSPGGELTLSLYPVNDTSFRRPAHRLDVPSRTELRVPAGSWLASLSHSGAAPDLHLVSASPAAPLTLDYTHRPGWSAVLFVASAENHLPVTAASAELRPTPGYGTERPRHGRTSEAGLVTFSGIGSDLTDVLVQHDELLPAKAAAVSATAGSFIVRQVELQVGGHLVAEVMIDGEPIPGTRCILREASSDELQPWRELSTAVTDEEGHCAAGPSPPAATACWCNRPPRTRRRIRRPARSSRCGSKADRRRISHWMSNGCSSRGASR